MDKLLNSWFNLLDGNVTYGGNAVSVYPTDPANDDYDHHIILRGESETDDSNKTTFVTLAVVTVDIVTVHPVSINKSIVNDIDGQIRALLFPSRKHNLDPLIDLQITNVTAQGGSYLEEDDGTRKYHRKVTRWVHRITQTDL